jgi:predicted nucleic acid-binding protein
VGLVLDTSALIAVERIDGSLEDHLGDLASRPAIVPAIVYAELQVGVRLADTPERAASRRSRIEALIGRLPIVEFDRSIADRWAELFATLMRDGAMIPANDLAVAATAMHFDFRVLLGPEGEEHYERVPGLRLVRLNAHD